jgi:hypothetical protein
MTDDDHNLDDLKNRLSRGFGVQVREDLQVRAEIIIQPEEGRWVFTPNELSDLAEGLESVLFKSRPEGPSFETRRFQVPLIRRRQKIA